MMWPIRKFCRRERLSMNDIAAMPQFDRTQEDLGNIVELGHVNVTVPDQSKAIAFYVMGLGLTRDPYLMAGLENMWVNVGRNQFHLPTREPQVVRGTTALVIPDRGELLTRLSYVRKYLEGTKFNFHETNDAVETICPWGNRIRVHEPDAARFGQLRLGMPYVEFDVPAKSDLHAIVRFYREIVGAIAGVAKDVRGEYVWVSMSADSKVTYRPTDKPLPEYDGHHIQITLTDFSGPHKKLLERGLISEESDQHQYRFVDIVDVDTNKPIFRIEHETRSMRHPMFNRTFVNRNPDMNNRNYTPGYEVGLWALN
jgi:catechol 2,3-dioxygenase-like lactoylglutathione lyase family enzyme